MEITLGGLFSGIGGFELAAQWAGITPLWSNEIDSFPCKVLRKNFQHEIIEADIRTIGKGREHELTPVDIICGGFPCQPFSTAGKRQGTDDDRYLWPEMLRIISEGKPSFVVGENVAGLLSMDNGRVFEEICTSLENEGYNVEAFVIPACATGAPHKRDRVWIVAYAFDGNVRGASRGLQEKNKRKGLQQEQPVDQFGSTSEIHGLASNAIGTGTGFQYKEQETSRQKWEACSVIQSQMVRPRNWAPDAKRIEPGYIFTSDTIGGRWNEGEGWTNCIYKNTWKGYRGWNKNWQEVATRLCRVDDGLPAWVDSHRTRRLKALGNAIVPQVAYEIFKSILQTIN